MPLNPTLPKIGSIDPCPQFVQLLCYRGWEPLTGIENLISVRKISCILLLLISLITHAQQITDDSLFFNGQVNEWKEETPLVNAKLEVFFNDTILFRTVTTNDSGYYKFNIPFYPPRVYKVKVSYPLYIYKYFEIDTKDLPKNTGRFPQIQAFIGLWKAEKGINYDFFELPLNRYYYNKYKDNFEYDASYLRASMKAMEVVLEVENRQRKEKTLLLEKAEKEKKLIEQSAVITQSKTEKNYLYLILVLILIGTFVIVIAFLKQKKLRKLIDQQKTVVEIQKRILEEKQDEIVDSITYAKRLQQAILPSPEFIKLHLPDHFIYYLPKDIVAGDFYWAELIENKFYIAAADSTGHGVPGAIVSVICSNALNRSVKEFKMREPGQILDKANELVVETFERSGMDIKDGMDISLLCIDKSNRSVSWSGANNPLWYTNNNEIFEIKADKQPIGKSEHIRPFITHKITSPENTNFYLFTDGFADQFGGPNGKKYKYKQFTELVLKVAHMDPLQQKIEIDKSFSAWKGNLEQVDDVCIIGIKM